MDSERNVYGHLERMRQRLEMYLGDRCIRKLEHYLHGYDAALGVHGIAEGDAPRFSQFLWWLLATQPKGGWKCGWAHGLLERTGGDNEAALERFFALAAEFGRLQVVEGSVVEVPQGWDRTPAYLAANRSPREVPDRLQLMSLRPGNAAFLRECYAARTHDQSIECSHLPVLRQVEWEYGIPADAFGVTLPEPEGRQAELQERWKKHQRALDARAAEAVNEREGPQN